MAKIFKYTLQPKILARLKPIICKSTKYLLKVIIKKLMLITYRYDKNYTVFLRDREQHSHSKLEPIRAL